MNNVIFSSSYTGRTYPGVSSLTATAATSTSIDLSWSSIGGTGYKIYENDVQIDDVSSSITSLTVSSLSIYTSYNFYIKGYNSSGTGSPSNTATVTTKFEPTALTTPTITWHWRGDSGLSLSGLDVLSWTDRINSLVILPISTGGDYLASGLGGKPAIHFDGVADGFTVNNADLSNATGYTMFVVCDEPATDNNAYSILVGITTTATFGLGYDLSGSNNKVHWTGAVTNLSGGTCISVPPASIRVFRTVGNGVLSTLYDGIPGVLLAGPSNMTSDLSQYRLDQTVEVGT